MTPPGSASVDRVTWALPYGEPDTLDPAKTVNYSEQTVTANLCETLLRVNPDFSTVPGLAERIDWKDDHSLVIDLRPGVRFWDGTPMRPQDVVYSLKRQSDPQTGGLYGDYLSTVTSIDVTGPNQVTLRTKAYDQVLVKSLSTPFGAVVQEAHARTSGPTFGKPGGGLMCTGPYKLGSWQAGQAITLQRNDSYWDPQVSPKAAQVDFRFITDSGALTRALASGEVDGAYEVPPATAAALADAKSGTVNQGPSTQNLLLVPATSDSPAADRRLLEALSLVLDREALIDKVFDGAADPLKTLIPRTMWTADLAGPQLTTAYDLLPDAPGPSVKRAKELLSEVGIPSHPLVVAATAGDQGSVQTAEFLKSAAAKIGVAIDVRTIPATQMTALSYDPAIRRGFDLVVTFGYVGADALTYLGALTDPDGAFNWANYHDPDVTRLLDQARTTPDLSTGAQSFVDAQARYTASAKLIFLAAPYEQMFLNRRISGAPSSFAYLSMPWAASIGGTA
ncbi:ABC transporter substrate-binding protein [Yinghuangia aomiensis]|uniref:ABC transporter substrate-binding protein n=1 Tax=Yinghuangia aomiensis TaxID=676205 RepID=UPI0031F16A47